MSTDRINPLGLSGSAPPRSGAGGGLGEIGSSGLKSSAGFIREEFLDDLRGPRGVKKYREMADNSPTVGACLSITEMLIRQAPWYFEPGVKDPTREDHERVEYFEQFRNDMSMPWGEVVGEHLSMLTYGWSYSELVYKVRNGESDDSSEASKYNDGLVAWRKIALRGQDTLQRWELDKNGGIRGLWQLDPNGGRGLVLIPIDKALLFRPKAARNNPEGRSVLRNAYYPWYFLKRITEVEGIGIERDLNGLPVFEIPARCFSENATPDDRKTREAAEEIVRNIRFDEQEGIVIGQAYENGMPMYKLSLLSSGGRRLFDTSAIIRRYNLEIAMTLVQDLVFMGQPNTIQYKGQAVPNLFAAALGGWADVICEIYNSFAVPRAMRLNGWPADRCPRLCHGEIQVPDLGPIGDFISKITSAGFAWSGDPAVDAQLRRMARMPAADPNAPKPPGPAPAPPAPQPDPEPDPAPEPAPDPEPRKAPPVDDGEDDEELV